ncbi:TonB-dependent receptor domain-containing protein [Eilatimonas milleporae]|uniref:Outer membrane receptor protein involved in Fe transport n=1 Tax=Eilatimonas milleporae TaxID=911205 RepID=A0A3M0CJ36_9PROT|nr:TonB-dependent receptor [Eilatimonas milleporae]RMB08420.1 outer membrane receptor protein involved in Fe transport [Eilatimonas milleporae]
MKTSTRHTWGRTALIGVVTAIAITGASPGAHTQEDAVIGTVRSVRMAPQPLGDALILLSDIYQVSIFADEALVRGKRSGPLSGDHALKDALARVLDGTGLTASRSRNGAYVISRRAVPPDDPSSRPVSGDTGQPPVTELIIVYGERQRRSLNETLSSVSILGADAIEEAAQNSVYEAVTGLPNVAYVAGNGFPAIRGQASTPVGTSLGNSVLSGVQPRTLLIIDDFARAASWPNTAYTSLFDVEQVEVFRGPQSTLRGRNAISGAFIIHTQDPSFEAEGRAVVEGTYNEFTEFGYRLGGAVSAPLVSNQVAARIGVQHQIDNDVYEDFLPGTYTGTADVEDVRKIETTAINGKLLITPKAVPDLEVNLTASYVEGITNLNPGLIAGPDAGADFDDRFYGLVGDVRIVDFDSRFYGLDATYYFTDTASLQLLVSYGEDDYQTNEDRSSSSVVFNPSEDTVFTAETVFRLGAEDGFINGLTGLAYAQTETRLDSVAFGAFPLTADTVTDTYSLYSDVRINPTDRLELTLGGRVLHTEQIRSFFFFSPLIADEEFDDTAILPQVGVLYRLNDEQSLGLSVRRGYSDGARAPNTVLATSFAFDPEFVWTVEGTYRLVSSDGRFTLAATAFYNDYRDQQFNVQVTASPISFETINLPASRSYGFELETTLEVRDDLSLTAGLGLLDTKVTETAPVGFTVEEGNEFGLDPDISLNIGVDWRPTDRIGFDGRLSYVGEYFSTVTNTPGDEAGDYFLLDLGATADLGPVTARIFVQNVTDELAFTSRFQNLNANVTQPRTVGITLSADF